MKRRSHYINVRFHDGKLSSVIWSPYRECWPRDVQIAVAVLKRDMAHAIHDGAVSDAETPGSDGERTGDS